MRADRKRSAHPQNDVNDPYRKSHAADLQGTGESGSFVQIACRHVRHAEIGSRSRADYSCPPHSPDLPLCSRARSRILVSRFSAGAASELFFRIRR